ncbi:MAG TPA: GntR family transcriptional regulator, partial [Rhizomicrobium sp.]
MGTLYETVKSALRDRIVSGRYQPGQKIPSESELIREFGVSAITVRRAVRDLTIEGRLIGRQGLGVLVADRRRITRSL